MSAFDGTIALITGAGRGVGRATAIELARAGARVAILARSRDDLEETSYRMREVRRSSLVVPGISATSVDSTRSCAK